MHLDANVRITCLMPNLQIVQALDVLASAQATVWVLLPFIQLAFSMSEHVITVQCAKIPQPPTLLRKA